MALPTGTIKLSEVIQHFIDKGIGTFTKLSECIAVFDPNSANNTYYVSPADRLSDFRGYDHIVITLTRFSLTAAGYGTSGEACNDHSHVYRWHDGAGTYPAELDGIYDTNDVNDPFVGLTDYWGVYTENSTLQINAGGKVLVKNLCPTAPGAPTNLASSNIGTTSITLSWAAPVNDGGNIITDYKIYQNGGLPYTTTGNDNTSKGISGLTAGDNDTWTVVAVNAVGDSVPISWYNSTAS